MPRGHSAVEHHLFDPELSPHGVVVCKQGKRSNLARPMARLAFGLEDGRDMFRKRDGANIHRQIVPLKRLDHLGRGFCKPGRARLHGGRLAQTRPPGLPDDPDGEKRHDRRVDKAPRASRRPDSPSLLAHDPSHPSRQMIVFAERQRALTRLESAKIGLAFKIRLEPSDLAQRLNPPPLPVCRGDRRRALPGPWCRSGL